MGKLTTAQRKRIPPSQYGLPAVKGSTNRGKYPMPDKAHARVAKSYASRYASPTQKAKIDAKANRVLGLSDKLSGLRKSLMGR